jgi:outer membrane protease
MADWLIRSVYCRKAMITAKQYLSVFLFCFFGILYAQEKPDSIIFGSLEITGGMLWGQSREFVLDGGNVMSRLDWDENWIPTVTIAGQITVFDFFLAASLRSAIPAKSGLMQDYDWYNWNTQHAQAELSDYSQSTAFLDKHFDTSVKLGYTWHLQNWSLIPSAGFSYRNRKWTASGGYGQWYQNGNSNWSSDKSKQPIAGAIISYEQEMYLLFAGLDVGWHINRRLEVLASGSVMPFMWANSLDNHFYNPSGAGKQFYDSMNGGFGWTAQLSALYEPLFAGGRFAFKLNVQFESIKTNSGTSASSAIGTGVDARLIENSTASKIESDLWALTTGIVFFL